MNDTLLQQGFVSVATTSGRGFTPEEIVNRALDKIIAIGDESHPAIQAQARAFRLALRDILLNVARDAIQSDRTTIAARLRASGHSELVSVLKE